ncbi:beta-lactamase family protein [Paenibacillus sp. alder61]|uniref:Beta-lactamase family protein n=1 Tax=Paenibacillus faecis TaxID=862114 RepID=A0A5D0CN66_9BACL|nr:MULTISPECIES: serine hydrolase domain-containing protein [Paenibacillus]MCA1292858.1 beta-lactamase family protein [Paenibacillus sp. alder61]TYA10705.1 beta-lactamase family protein [Paenibacillus faecis]
MRTSLFSIRQPLEQLKFNGAVYLQTGGQEGRQLTIGYADLEQTRPITESTLFYIASLTKMYTAAMILQLIDRGTIRLEDPLTGWFEARAPYDRVTIEHLLTHSSGIPEYFNPELGNVEAILKGDWEPYFTPGEGWLYTNTNYVLLARILGRTSRLSYEACLRNNIAGPLGLRHTTTRPDPEQIAVGKLYDYRERQFTPVTKDPLFKQIDRLYGHYDGDGGIYATAAEVARFMQGFLRGELVSHELVSRAITASPLSRGHGYGYGFIIQEEAFGHSGGWPGYSAHALCSWSGDDLTVLLTNEEVSPAYELQLLDLLSHSAAVPQEEFERRAAGLPPKHPEVLSVAGAAEEWNDLEGTYRLADEHQTSFTIQIDIESISPTVSFPDQLAAGLLKVEPHVYWIRNTMSYIDVARMIFVDEGIEVPFRKMP